MRWLRWLVFGLIVASLGGGLDASNPHGGPGGYGGPGMNKSRARGNEKGEYVLTVTGGYTGGGSAKVGTEVSLLVKVSDEAGGTGVLVANNLPVQRGYFTGKGMVMGKPCTIQGRVDLASARDEEQTDRQATTARITGSFQTDTGEVGRLVAVQKP